MFYDNMDEFAVDGVVPSFVNYVEGIYVATSSMRLPPLRASSTTRPPFSIPSATA